MATTSENIITGPWGIDCPMSSIHGKFVDGLNVLFDADLFVYRAGFSAAKPELEMLGEAIVCARLDSMLTEAWDDVHSKLGIPKTPASTAAMFLTGCKKVPNFREEVAPYYKANRTDTSRPAFYDELREHIIKEYATVVTEGVEADDYFGQASLDASKQLPNHQTVIVSLDKDLLMLEGVHYNFVKEEIRVVDYYNGQLFFFTQMLMGDRADNVPGLLRYGPKKAEKILRKARNSEDMFALSVQEYLKVFGKERWKHEWNVHCDLLWILRRLDEPCPWKTDGPGYKANEPMLPNEASWEPEEKEEDPANP